MVWGQVPVETLAAVTSRLTSSLDLGYDALQGGTVDGSPVPEDVLAELCEDRHARPMGVRLRRHLSPGSGRNGRASA